MTTKYTARLLTRISEPVRERLELAVTVKRQPMNRVLDDLLDQHLDSHDDLVTQLGRRGNGGGDRP